MSGAKVAGERFCLYDTPAVEAVLDRMAAQAATFLAGEPDPLLLGILRRGQPLAEMLQARLKAKHGLDVPCYGLRLKRYADDLTLLHPETELTENAEFSARDLSHATVLVVDDVLYEGHSLQRASAWLARLGAAETRTAVLVDRCVSRQPVRADIVGLRLQVAPTDIIECSVPPYEENFCIEVLRRALN